MISIREFNTLTNELNKPDLNSRISLYTVKHCIIIFSPKPYDSYFMMPVILDDLAILATTH